jgi:hypothetical protein
MPHHKPTIEELRTLPDLVHERPDDFDLPSAIGDVANAAWNKRFERLGIQERFRREFMPTDHEILIEVRDRLRDLEARLSQQPSLIIMGNAVTEEWEKITKNRGLR